MQTTTPPWIPEENPALDGPDYVALVIEWDEDQDQATEVDGSAQPRRPLLKLISSVIGAVGALALTAWGIHKLRAA